jgi:energy-coupling factor transporter ATP-binding protein EcfA2
VETALASTPFGVRAASLPVPWRQGEHVAIIGQTGSGKTTLEVELLRLRDHVVVIRTKSDSVKFDGYTHATAASAMDRLDIRRLVLQPKRGHQAVEIWTAIEKAWKQGRWTVAVDELFYVHQKLRLGDEVDMLLTQGRGTKLTAVVGMQRPSRISRFAISEVTHAFVFTIEGRDAKQIIGEALSPRVAEIAMQLRKHEFVYYYRPDRLVVRGYTQQLASLVRKG